MTDALLVLNVGSSSVKFRVFGAEESLPLLAAGRVTGIGSTPLFSVKGEEPRNLPENLTQKQALQSVLDWIDAADHDWRVIAAGHRIVHGGAAFSAPVLLTPEILQKLDGLVPLAPLHQPHNLAAVRALAEIYPDLKQIGCFDTAFHAGHEAAVYSFALPEHLRGQGVRRYGFHGLSYEWVAHLLAAEGGLPPRVIAAHLGNGASLCAIKDGKSIDTTMGMTALDGLPMGTRTGALDPGAVIYLLRSCGLSLDEVEHMFYHVSGLKGLSGGVSDMKLLLEDGGEKAEFAVDYFIRKVAQYVAVMAASLGGIDLLVFTGGIGENAAPVRDGILARLGFLGDFKNRIIAADEERMIAKHILKEIGNAA